MERRRRRFRGILLGTLEQYQRVNSQRYLQPRLGRGRGLRTRRDGLFEYYLHMDDVWFKQFVSIILEPQSITE